MSIKQWIALLMIFWLYLLLGATIYHHIEGDGECELPNKSCSDIDKFIHKHCSTKELNGTLDFLQDFLQNITAYCDKPVFHDKVNKWDFYNSFYFAYTVVSTIGYGNPVPKTMLGRILMIFYALIGIPMNGILLSQLGKYFGKVFVKAYKKYESYKSGRASPGKRFAKLEMLRASLATQIFMYLTPGFLLFIFLPAFLISYVETWPYHRSVYYAFVTLSTIGFGDYIAGQGNAEESGYLLTIYKIFLFFWIFFGLGYLVMIMNFIAQGMRSKRMKRIKQKLSENLKQTQDIILNEFNKDLNYLRRTFNELCLMRIEPVYRYEYESEIRMGKFPRSCSFPNLRDLEYGCLEPEMRIPQMNRSNSEAEPEVQFEAIDRAVSESDLSMINKKATFALHALVQPAKLLAGLVTILGYIPPSDEFKPSEEDTGQSVMKGVDGFSEKEMKTGEKSWGRLRSKINGDNLPEKLTRAASEIILRNQDDGLGRHNRESSWSGPAASRRIQELGKARQKSGVSGIPASSVPKTIRPRWFNPFSSKKNNADENLPTGQLLSADETEMNHMKNCASHTTSSRLIEDSDRDYSTHTEGDLRNQRGSNLLEETSLADFLRAMTNLHSRIGAVPEDFVEKPHRKMSMANQTPPEIPNFLAPFGRRFSGRRFSLKHDDNSDASPPSYPRRGFSLMSRIGLNRFSVRPDDNSNTVTSAYSQRRRSQLARAPDPRTFSSRSRSTSGGNWRNTPPYTADIVPFHIRERQNPPAHSADPFMFEKSQLILRRRMRMMSLDADTAVKNNRHTGLTSRTSSLALSNATSNRNRPTQTTEKFDSKKLTTFRSQILSHKKIDDARQNDESNDEKRREEAKTVGLESTDPFGLDILAEKSAESTASGLDRATPVSMIKIDDHKARNNDQSLHSVVVDKPLSKPTLLFVSSLSDSLHDVKVDSADRHKPASLRLKSVAEEPQVALMEL